MPTPETRPGRGIKAGRAALIIAQSQVFIDERKLAKSAIRESIRQSYGTDWEPEITERIENIWMDNYYAGAKLAASHNDASRRLLEHLKTSILAGHHLLPLTIEFGFGSTVLESEG